MSLSAEMFVIGNSVVRERTDGAVVTIDPFSAFSSRAFREFEWDDSRGQMMPEEAPHDLHFRGRGRAESGQLRVGIPVRFDFTGFRWNSVSSSQRPLTFHRVSHVRNTIVTIVFAHC